MKIEIKVEKDINGEFWVFLFRCYVNIQFYLGNFKSIDVG